MTQGTGGDTGGQRLMTRDHVNLTAQDLVECISASTHHSVHAGIMRLESDKTPLRKYHQIAANPAFPRELSLRDSQAPRQRWNIAAAMTAPMFHRCGWYRGEESGG
jgi:hypothetical protein